MEDEIPGENYCAILFTQTRIAVSAPPSEPGLLQSFNEYNVFWVCIREVNPHSVLYILESGLNCSGYYSV